MADTLTAQEPLIDENGAQIIAPTLHHTGNVTSRPEEMLDWYRKVLGQYTTLIAAPPATPMPGVWTTNDWAHHRMGFFKFPVKDQLDPSGPHVNHVAWEYDNVDDWLESVMRIKALGIMPAFCVNHLTTFASYYRDPDGNLVELLTDGFGDHAKSLDAQLHSEEVQANPPGVPFDFTLMYAARQEGATLDELRIRSRAGEWTPADAPNHDVNPDLLED